MARPSQFLSIFWATALMYQAYGKSDTLSVTAPPPCGEPAAWPSGTGGGGAEATAGAVSRRGAGDGALDARGSAEAGSSLSPGRGSAAAREGNARSRSGSVVVSRAVRRAGI